MTPRDIGSPDDSPRARILERIRRSLSGRDTVEHPGRFEGWRPAGPARNAIDRFAEAFHSAGGRCVRMASLAAASKWLSELSPDYDSMTIGVGVPDEVVPPLPMAAPEEARLAVSLARGAVAETGTLLLDARDGRRTQLLSPTHVVVVRAETVHMDLVDALATVRDDLPSAVGLHSGPSKSADIGQVMVRGVHGPGEIIAVVVGEGA